ncbi:MAG: DUF5677 domain-containing protein [Bacteroidota bacterium]
MTSEKLGQLNTERLIENEYKHHNKKYFILCNRLLKKYGLPKFINNQESSDYLLVTFDVVLFCFTKSLRLHKSIDAIIGISNYEDAFALLRGSYEAYVYMAYLNNDPMRVTDSIFKIGVQAGIYVHPLNKKGKTIKNKIIDTRDNNIYDYGAGIFERVSGSKNVEDIQIHNTIYPFLSEHCHIHFITSGNYRDERTKKIKYSVNNITHEQYLNFLFLKTFIYTNIFCEVAQYFSLTSKEKLLASELISENKRFLSAILKIVSFNDYNGKSINHIFNDRISKIQTI